MNQSCDFLQIRGKVTIVTGAAAGFGAATAQMPTAAGANVMINHMP